MLLWGLNEGNKYQPPRCVFFPATSDARASWTPLSRVLASTPAAERRSLEGSLWYPGLLQWAHPFSSCQGERQTVCYAFKLFFETQSHLVSPPGTKGYLP